MPVPTNILTPAAAPAPGTASMPTGAAELFAALLAGGLAPESTGSVVTLTEERSAPDGTVCDVSAAADGADAGAAQLLPLIDQQMMMQAQVMPMPVAAPANGELCAPTDPEAVTIDPPKGAPVSRRPATPKDVDTPHAPAPAPVIDGPAKRSTVGVTERPDHAPAERPVSASADQPQAAPVARQVATGADRPVAHSVDGPDPITIAQSSVAPTLRSGPTPPGRTSPPALGSTIGPAGKTPVTTMPAGPQGDFVPAAKPQTLVTKVQLQSVPTQEQTGIGSRVRANAGAVFAVVAPDLGPAPTAAIASEPAAQPPLVSPNGQAASISAEWTRASAKPALPGDAPVIAERVQQPLAQAIVGRGLAALDPFQPSLRPYAPEASEEFNSQAKAARPARTFAAVVAPAKPLDTPVQVTLVAKSVDARIQPPADAKQGNAAVQMSAAGKPVDAPVQARSAAKQLDAANSDEPAVATAGAAVMTTRSAEQPLRRAPAARTRVMPQEPAVGPNVQPITPKLNEPVAVALGSTSAAAADQTVATPQHNVVQAPKLDAPLAVPPQPSVAAALSDKVLDLSRDTQWIDQLARDIVGTSGRDSTLRFRLAPEQLGALKVEITQGDQGAHVRLHTATETAQQVLTAAQPKLIEEARMQGVRIADTQVSLTSSGGDTQAQSQGDSARQRAQAAQQETPSRTARAATTHTTGATASQSRRSDRYA